MNIQITVYYELRTHPDLSKWVVQPAAEKPWQIVNGCITSWDESVLGIPQPNTQKLIDDGPLAAAWWPDYQRTRKAEMQDEVIRAAVLVILDDRNVTAQWLTDFKAAVAAATTLADLKTRVAALPACPQRTAQQIKDAIKAKLE